MTRVAVRALAISTLLLLAAALAGCGGGGASKTATPARSPSTGATSSAAAGTTATPSLGIRSLDLSAVPDVQAMIAATGGQYVQTSVIYGDLTGDGIDDAIVPISSGGTLGDVAFLVLTPSGGSAKTLLKEQPFGTTPRLSVAVVDGQLVMTQPLYGPEDPNCCPSALRKTTYVWNGSALVAQSIKTETNPAGGVKTTPTP